MADELILIARVGAAHGVRGEVRVKPFGLDGEAIGDHGPLRSHDGARRLTVDRVRPIAGGMVIVKFIGIDDRTAAERLNHLDLFVERAALPEPDEDEFYHADLIGLAVVTVAGEPIGHVIAVQDFGAGDLLEVDRPGKPSVFVPFTKAVVPTVEIAKGRVVIDPPIGLLDEAEPGPKRRRSPPKSGHVDGDIDKDAGAGS
jgi:16S rRNA processing protein RimM